MFGDVLFNIDHGYLEGLVRGFKSGILKSQDYNQLVQAETLEGKSFILFDLIKNNWLLCMWMCRFKSIFAINWLWHVSSKRTKSIDSECYWWQAKRQVCCWISAFKKSFSEAFKHIFRLYNVSDQL